MQNQTNTQIAKAIIGKRVLIVEDEAFVALDLKVALESYGVDVIGPIATLEDALSAVAQDDFDVAVVDVHLQGQDSFPAADILLAKGTPFVWHTGAAELDNFGDDYPDVPVLEKPTRADDIITVLAKLATTGDDAGADTD